MYISTRQFIAISSPKQLHEDLPAAIIWCCAFDQRRKTFKGGDLSSVKATQNSNRMQWLPANVLPASLIKAVNKHPRGTKDHGTIVNKEILKLLLEQKHNKNSMLLSTWDRDSSWTPGVNNGYVFLTVFLPRGRGWVTFSQTCHTLIQHVYQCSLEMERGMKLREG